MTIATSNGKFMQELAVPVGDFTFPVSSGRNLTIAANIPASGTYKFIGYLAGPEVVSRIKHYISAADVSISSQLGSVSGWAEVGIEVTVGTVDLEVLESKI